MLNVYIYTLFPRLWGEVGVTCQSHIPLISQYTTILQADVRPGCAGEPADHPDGDAEELPHQHLPGQPRLHRPPPHSHLHPRQGEQLFRKSFDHFLKMSFD